METIHPDRARQRAACVRDSFSQVKLGQVIVIL